MKQKQFFQQLLVLTPSYPHLHFNSKNSAQIRATQPKNNASRTTT